MRQALHHLSQDTRGKGLYDLTRPVTAWVAAQALRTGLLTLFCRHTSASLLIQENAEPHRVALARSKPTFGTRPRRARA